MNASQKLKFVLDRVENILGNGENAGDQHFLLFPKYFYMPCSSGSLKVIFEGKGLKIKFFAREYLQALKV